MHLHSGLQQILFLCKHRRAGEHMQIYLYQLWKLFFFFFVSSLFFMCCLCKSATCRQKFLRQVLLPPQERLARPITTRLLGFSITTCTNCSVYVTNALGQDIEMFKKAISKDLNIAMENVSQGKLCTTLFQHLCLSVLSTHAVMLFQKKALPKLELIYYLCNICMNTCLCFLTFQIIKNTKSRKPKTNIDRKTYLTLHVTV